MANENCIRKATFIACWARLEAIKLGVSLACHSGSNTINQWVRRTSEVMTLFCSGRAKGKERNSFIDIG